jgi:hypothetical protein
MYRGWAWHANNGRKALWERQLQNLRSYWARYSFPGIANNDPTFVRPIPRNAWGGASQPLTALRALRWMEHYGKGRERGGLMESWCEAIVSAGAFYQRMDPETGLFTRPDPGGYSPSALVSLHFARRLGRAQPRTTTVGAIREGDQAGAVRP